MSPVYFAQSLVDKVVEHLEKDSLALIEWFSCNQMKANSDKCQALAIGKKSMDTNIAFECTRLLFDNHLLINIIGAFYCPMQAWSCDLVNYR
jgi:hypothetical protein